MEKRADGEAPIDVAVLMIGIDERARARVQGALDEIAEGGDSGSPEGLLDMLREAIDALRAEERAWTHAGVSNASPMPPAEAEEAFVTAVERVRKRYEHEVVRNHDGELVRTPAPPLPPSDEPGRVVVTLVVAARRELRDAAPGERRSLAEALDDLRALRPEELVALEVVWSPAEDADRMSLEAMRERYPELAPLEPLAP